MSDSLHTEAATAERYWVVGGNYETMEFDRVVPGTEDVFGPFGSIQDAESVWRCVAEKTRYQATVRYTIAAEQTCMPQASYRPEPRLSVVNGFRHVRDISESKVCQAASTSSWTLMEDYDCIPI